MQGVTHQVRDEERRNLVSPGREVSYASVVRHTPGDRGGSTLIEPVMFLFLVAKALSDTVITNLLEYRTCRVQLTLPDVNCSDPISAEVEDLVQPTTAHVITGRALIEAFVPSCLAILIGPWSDVNGRKPFLVLALAGLSVSYLTWGCLALVPGLYPLMFLLASLPMSLSGGSCAIYLLCFCYTSDVTDEKTRPFRMSFLILAIAVSPVLGTALAPILVAIQHTVNPYPPIFFLSAFLLLLTALYTQRCIQESVDIQPYREKRLFRFSHARHLFTACFKPRDGHARSMTLLIIATLMLNVFLVEGEGAIMYLSVREMFFWQLSDYTTFSCFGSIVSGLGTLFGVWLFNSALGWTSMPAAVLVLSTRCARCVLLAVARTGVDFYVSAAISSLATSYAPFCRTELSRLVPKQDLGKVFALTAFLESVTPIPSTPLYTYIYEDTFLYAPSSVYWLSAALSATSVMMVTTVSVIQRLVNGACYIRDCPQESEHVKLID